METPLGIGGKKHPQQIEKMLNVNSFLFCWELVTLYSQPQSPKSPSTSFSIFGIHFHKWGQALNI